MRIIDLLRGVRRALLIGIGGGGDIVSTIPVSMFFEKFDVECIHAGVVWERISRDPKPGPRSIEEISGCRRINDCLAWIDGKCRIDGLKPIVAQVSEYLGRDVVGVDITKGELGVRESLRDFIRDEGIDLVVGVDAGGDSLARGGEENLCSPLADSIMLSAIGKFNSLLAIIGFGSDGELRRDELEEYLSVIAGDGGLIGVSVLGRDEAERLLEFVRSVPTEASKIPLMAATGYRGRYVVWGRYDVYVSIINALTFYLDVRRVLRHTRLPKIVEGSKSIYEANERLHRFGIRTELDIELEEAGKLESGRA